MQRTSLVDSPNIRRLLLMLLDSTNVSAVELESLTFSEPANHMIISDNNLS